MCRSSRVHSTAVIHSLGAATTSSHSALTRHGAAAAAATAAPHLAPFDQTAPPPLLRQLFPVVWLVPPPLRLRPGQCDSAVSLGLTLSAAVTATRSPPRWRHPPLGSLTLCSSGPDVVAWCTVSSEYAPLLADDRWQSTTPGGIASAQPSRAERRRRRRGAVQARRGYAEEGPALDRRCEEVRGCRCSGVSAQGDWTGGLMIHPMSRRVLSFSTCRGSSQWADGLDGHLLDLSIG